MKIGLISDTHDSLEGVNQAFNIFKLQKVNQILHCGDWITIPTVKYISQKAQELKIPIKGVLGNNDTELNVLLENNAQIDDYVEFPDQKVFEFNINDKKLCMYHGEDKAILDALIKSHKYNIIFTGHTHNRRNDNIKDCIVINPGSASFRARKPKNQKTSIGIYDINSNNLQFFTLTKPS